MLAQQSGCEKPLEREACELVMRVNAPLRVSNGKMKGAKGEVTEKRSVKVIVDTSSWYLLHNFGYYICDSPILPQD